MFKIKPLDWYPTTHGVSALGISGIEYRVDEGSPTTAYLYDDYARVALGYFDTKEQAVAHCTEHHERFLLPWLEKTRGGDTEQEYMNRLEQGQEYETTTQGYVLQDVVHQRNYQDDLWGANQTQDNYKWNAILGEEVGKVSKKVLWEDNDGLYWELLSVAAVAVAWAEDLVNRNV